MFLRKFVLVPDGFGSGSPMVMHKPQRKVRQAIDSHSVVVQSIGKGNTKSSSAAGYGLHWISDPPPGDLEPYCPVVSGSKEQARAGVYDTAVSMVESSPELRGLFTVYSALERPRIVSNVTGGIMRPLAPTPRRLHGIKPSLGLADELGLIHDPKVWRTMLESLGKRPGATLFGFGTPGWERGELWRLRQKWVRGELENIICWLEWAADEGCDIDDEEQWLQANPMRALLDPKGWKHALRVIRAGSTDDEFRIFHLTQWPEMTGLKLVTPARWKELADPDKEDAPALRFVTVEGDYARRNVAVISVDAFDGHAHVRTEAVWEHQEDPVPVTDIVAAVLTRGHANGVTMRSTGQLDDVETALAVEGVPVERMDTHAAAKMRQPTDAWLTAITAGTVTHDGNPILTKHLGNTRLEPRREGLTLTRDERSATDEAARVDAALAAIVAVHLAHTVAVPMIH